VSGPLFREKEGGRGFAIATKKIRGRYGKNEEKIFEVALIRISSPVVRTEKRPQRREG